MNKTIIEQDLKYIWHPYRQAQTAKPPMAISRAQGAYLYTESGQKLFDGISSWWLTAHGHCHPVIAQAIAKQVQVLEQVNFGNFTHEPAVTLARKLIERAPGSLSRVFYSDNGSTAVEVALKMAYQYWQNRGESRGHFVALKHGYHGDTFGAMAASARSIFTKPFWPLLFDVIHADSPCLSEVDAHRSEAMLTEQALASLEAIFRQYPRQIAGLVIEPMLQGAGGMRIFTKGFLAGAARLSKEHNILLIADEAATGFYRTGTLFAYEHEQISPDILCLAKALTGGFLPLAATLATENIFEGFLSDSKANALLHGHSYAGNPIGCAAGVASLELFDHEQTQACIRDICQVIANRVPEFSNLPGVKNARFIGATAVVELHDDQAGYLSSTGARLDEFGLERGLYLRPLGNIVYLMPPLCTTAEEMNWAFDVVKDALLNIN